MPQYYSTDLDDEPVQDGALTFSGGMFSNAKPRMLKPEQAAILQDCEIEVTGEAASRRGTVQIGGTVGSGGGGINGIGYYKTTSNTYELAAPQGDGVYKLNGGVWTKLGTQNFGSGNIELVQGGVSGGSATVGDDKLYVCGAGTDIFRWDGSAWLNVSSPETGASAPRNAYLLCWHTGRLVAAGVGIKTRAADATAVPDAVYFSNILQPDTWGFTTYDTQLRVGGGDGAEIVSFLPWTDFRLAVFKRNSTWVIDADPTFAVSDMPIQLVHGSVGCIARRTAVQVGGDVLFLSQDGVRSLQQTIASDQQHELALPMSFPVQDYFNRINWGAAANACAAFWNNHYYISIPLDSSTTNNYIFVFNTITSTWDGYWTNLPVSCFQVRKGTTQSLMAGMDATNMVIEFLDYVHESDATNVTYSDWNGNGVQPAVATRAFTFGDPKAFKKGLDYEIEYFNSQGTVVITPVFDEDVLTPNDSYALAPWGFAIPFNLPLTIGAAGLQRKPFDLMRRKTFREALFLVTTHGAGRKELRQLQVQAFMEAGNQVFPQGLNTGP